MTWDVEVEDPGTFEVVMYYALKPGDEGVAAELSFLENKLEAVLDEAHDPPLIGAEDDRTPRQESYTKHFKPLALGSLEMAAGRGELTLRAGEIPGNEAFEIHSLFLTRKP